MVVGLLANGRAIGAGDTRVMEETARSLSQDHSFVLPASDAADPFTRPLQGGRISIYPPLTAVLAAPFFAVFGLLFDLDTSGTQAAGKLFAAGLAAAAVALLATIFARRSSPAHAVAAALLFGLGTSVYSTAQALWQHGTAILFLILALDAADRLWSSQPEHGHLVAGASIFLSLAAAARPASIPMCAILGLLVLGRSRRNLSPALTAALVPASLVAAYNVTFFGAPWAFGPRLAGRFFGALPASLPGLLISPARGLFVFTPIALIALFGLLQAARTKPFARALLSAVAAHILFLSAWNEWHGGESFGPRLLTDMLPALFFFLPEALERMPRLGLLLGALSVGIQLLGGWTYDYRWERLHQRGQDFEAALWQWSDSPIAFALKEHTLTQGVPVINGRVLRLRPYRFVPFGPQGSSVEPRAEGLQVSGPPLIRDIHLERGASASRAGIQLSHQADALAFRSLCDGMMSLRIVGQGDGVVRVEADQGSISVPVNGAFDVRAPLRLRTGESVFVRAEAGELRLFKAVLKVNPAVSEHPPI